MRLTSNTSKFLTGTRVEGHKVILDAMNFIDRSSCMYYNLEPISNEERFLSRVVNNIFMINHINVGTIYSDFPPMNGILKVL